MKVNGKKRYIVGTVFFLIGMVLCVEKLSHFGENFLGNSSDSQEEYNSFRTEEYEDARSSLGQEEQQGEAQQNAHRQSLMDPTGDTLQTRIHTPAGYTRQVAASGSLEEFIRNYKMKTDGEKVLLYNGNEKGNQSAHVAVFTLPIENVNLQQCADSVMRMYAEYYWSIGAYDKIKFYFTNGFLAEYEKWREGYRIVVDGNHVSWSKSASFDDSYESLVKYLRVVFSYAGTLSMDSFEAREIVLEEAEVGDVFLQGGSPGHVVMIVDICVNEEGKKAFLLAQGYMPAQEFHVLKNPLHEENPWYLEEEITYPLSTPEYTFQEGSLKSLYERFQ